MPISKDPADYRYTPPPERTRRVGRSLSLTFAALCGASWLGVALASVDTDDVPAVAVTAALALIILTAARRTTMAADALAGVSFRQQRLRLAAWALLAVALGLVLRLAWPDVRWLAPAWLVLVIGSTWGPDRDSGPDGPAGPESRWWPSRDPDDYR